jgi:hypothetical protein
VEQVLPNAEGLKIDVRESSGDVAVIGYRVRDPNCAQTYGNAYFLTREEKKLYSAAAGMGPGEVRTLSETPDRARYIAVLPNVSPVQIMADIETEDDRERVVIHSNQLRTYAPSSRFHRAQAHGLGIEFVNRATGAKVLVRSQDVVGKDNFFAPWVLQTQRLPPGTYAIDLVVGRLVTPFGVSENIRVRLTDRFKAKR